MPNTEAASQPTIRNYSQQVSGTITGNVEALIISVGTGVTVVDVIAGSARAVADPPLPSWADAKKLDDHDIEVSYSFGGLKGAPYHGTVTVAAAVTFGVASPQLAPAATPKSQDKLLIFGNHFNKRLVYIVTSAPDFEVKPSNDPFNAKYISHCCSGPDQILDLTWDQIDTPLNVPYIIGKYTVLQVRLAVHDEAVDIQPAAEGLPEVSSTVAHCYDDEKWWIFNVAPLNSPLINIQAYR